jgi:RND superfamily putative drug exporter
MQNDPHEPAAKNGRVDAVSDPMRRTNLAGRMGRWSAHHRKIAVFGWLAFALAAFYVGNFVTGTNAIVFETSGPGESGRAEKILYEEFRQPADESVFIQSRSLQAGDAAFDAVVRDVVAGVRSLQVVKNVRSPLEQANEGQISPDQHAVLVDFQIRGDPDKAQDKIGPVVDRVVELQRQHPQLFIGSFGTSAGKQLQDSFKNDLTRAGLLSLPLTLLILLLTFGALVAAGLTLLLALTGVIAALGLVAILSHALPIDENSVPAIILLIGLAVGVDYAMFYVRREREERAAGRSAEAALEVAAATSGRSVLVSGLTVMVAMAGMFLTGDAGFASFGMATMLVVAVAVLGSLTVLPAMLSKLGDRVERGRIPFLGRVHSDGRMWGAIIDRVLRRPVLSFALAGGVLVAAAIPAFQLYTAVGGPDTYPQDLPALKTYNRIQAAFPGSEIPANVVLKAPNVEAPAVKEAMGQLGWRVLSTGLMHEPITTDVNAAKTVANISIPVEGNGTDAKSKEALASLRDELLPGTLGTLADAEVNVTGITAQSEDINGQLRGVAPRVFGFVLVFAFLLMLVAFRSLVIAAKAIVLNLLSVGAAYGILVLVFQKGYGNGLLGLDFTGGIDPFLPILLFVILFGLSMDYHVFILSRVREAYDRGMSTDDAVAHGIKTTAGVVSSAAIVMVGVFAVFATLKNLIFKQFGVGLATAILIDATIVRAVLLPATMRLLGDRNWYLPKWLDWLPHLEHGDSPEKVEAPPAISPM